MNREFDLISHLGIYNITTAAANAPNPAMKAAPPLNSEAPPVLLAGAPVDTEVPLLLELTVPVALAPPAGFEVVFVIFD